ncbi:MAG: SxtJ family membrane protein [Cyanobacteriota bacterium]|nr:SxtJ family membrane protein [Cyanobacteriota bacterium]
MVSNTATPKPSRRQLREFGLLIGFAFPLLLGWLLPALHGAPFRSWTLVIAVPALLLGLLAPQTLAAPYRSWMALGHGLGWINSHIILGVVFVLVLQPIALLMRLAGHDPLRRRRNDTVSYREQRGGPATNFKRIF